jgi:transcriptional regulator with XRE-family HTH domain
MGLKCTNDINIGVCFKNNLVFVGELVSRSREIFGKNLKRLMKLRRMTVNELSESLGVDVSMVSRWRAGANLPTRYFDELAAALRVDLYEFFIDPTSKPAHPTTMEDWVEALANSIGYELKPKK